MRQSRRTPVPPRAKSEWLLRRASRQHWLSLPVASRERILLASVESWLSSSRHLRTGLEVPNDRLAKTIDPIAVTSPGGRFSRTRLSDKAFLIYCITRSPTNHWQLLRSLKLVLVQLLVQMLVREPSSSLALDLELHAQPLAHPMADVTVDVPVGFAHRPKTKVVGPTL